MLSPEAPHSRQAEVRVEKSFIHPKLPALDPFRVRSGTQVALYERGLRIGMGKMQLLDYLYLDTSKLADYMAAIDPGIVKELRETTKLHEEEDGGGTELDQPLASGVTTKRESTQERVLTISEVTSLKRLRTTLGESLKSFDEDIDFSTSDVSKREIVEITREFRPSPLSQLIDSMIDFTAMAQGMGVMEAEDPQTQQAIQGITMLFRGSGENQKDVPVVSSADGFETSVFFMAHRKYILRGVEALEGEATLFGKVEKIIPPGQDVDLFEMLKILPRGMRRSQTSTDLTNSLKAAFRAWPHELGGPISDDAFSLPGPLVVVSPLAVYR
ncbi:DUF6414 family protein [Streptomyces virginiae]|uniref:DUF6414 family protein n=1 Tax=Streptomyces virginiae TaxID=1961 RepID=UPI0033258D2E